MRINRCRRGKRTTNATIIDTPVTHGWSQPAGGEKVFTLSARYTFISAYSEHYSVDLPESEAIAFAKYILNAKG